MTKFSKTNQPRKPAIGAATDTPAPTGSDITATPEFQAAVDAAVGKAAEQIIAKLAGAREQAGTAAAGSSDAVFVDKLAMSIASLTHQGTGRGRPVAPDILAAREAAKDRMMALIVEARVAFEKAKKAGDEDAMTAALPTYTLKNKVYLGEVQIDPVFVGADHRIKKTEIDWDGVPNEAMVPVNKIAKAIHAEYRGWIGTQTGTPRDDTRGFSVTQKGLVIRGGSHSTNQIEANHTGEGVAAEGLRIRRGDQVDGPLAFKGKETNVLGTVHPAARQSA